MRAKTRTGNFHTCEGCDRADQDVQEGDFTSTIRAGEIRVVDGWKDEDGDWIGDTDEYPTESDAENDGYYNLEEASYLVCPDRNHDSDDGWEMEALTVAYTCGVCMKSYLKLDDAAKCCDEENN